MLWRECSTHPFGERDPNQQHGRQITLHIQLVTHHTTCNTTFNMFAIYTLVLWLVKELFILIILIFYIPKAPFKLRPGNHIVTATTEPRRDTPMCGDARVVGLGGGINQMLRWASVYSRFFNLVSYFEVILDGNSYSVSYDHCPIFPHPPVVASQTPH